MPRSSRRTVLSTRWTCATRMELVQEFLPIVDGGDAARRGGGLARRQGASGHAGRHQPPGLVTLVAGVLLSAMLLAVFRAAQVRLTRQQGQLIEATRRTHSPGSSTTARSSACLRRPWNRHAPRTHRSASRSSTWTISGSSTTRTVTKPPTWCSSAWRSRSRRRDAGHVARYGPTNSCSPARRRCSGDGRSVGFAGLEAESVQFVDSERLPISVSVGIAPIRSMRPP